MNNDHLDQQSKDIYELLVENQPRNKMFIGDFNKNFAPVLLGDVPMPEGEGFSQAYIAVAGGVSNPIDVVDAEGNVLFTSPPYQNNSSLDKYLQGDGRFFLGAAMDLKQLADGLPGHMNLWKDKAAKLADAVVSTEDNKYDADYQKMLAYYGRDKKPEGTVGSDEETDEFIYE